MKKTVLLILIVVLLVSMPGCVYHPKTTMFGIHSIGTSIDSSPAIQVVDSGAYVINDNELYFWNEEGGQKLFAEELKDEELGYLIRKPDGIYVHYSAVDEILLYSQHFSDTKVEAVYEIGSSALGVVSDHSLLEGEWTGNSMKLFSADFFRTFTPEGAPTFSGVNTHIYTYYYRYPILIYIDAYNSEYSVYTMSEDTKRGEKIYEYTDIEWGLFEKASMVYNDELYVLFSMDNIGAVNQGGRAIEDKYHGGDYLMTINPNDYHNEIVLTTQPKERIIGFNGKYVYILKDNVITISEFVKPNEIKEVGQIETENYYQYKIVEFYSIMDYIVVYGDGKIIQYFEQA